MQDGVSIKEVLLNRSDGKSAVIYIILWLWQLSIRTLAAMLAQVLGVTILCLARSAALAEIPGIVQRLSLTPRKLSRSVCLESVCETQSRAEEEVEAIRCGGFIRHKG